jgi:hypothetical protein
MKINTELLAKAFTEWERRYREAPDEFQTEAYKLLKETPETYGDAAAPYFETILREFAPLSLTTFEVRDEMLSALRRIALDTNHSADTRLSAMRELLIRLRC